MKRKEFLLGLILILGTTISLSAQDMFPLGWWQTRVVSGYTAHPDSVMLAIDSSRVRIHIQVYDNAEFDSICATSRQNDAWMILDRPRKRAYESGGYLSVTTSLLEHYPAQWDYDSLIFWKDLASQLADSLHYVADNYHVYAFHNAYYDGHTHYRRRRLYPGIRYLTERLKIGGDYKTFTYSSWDIKELFDTLDNRNNRGHDIIEYISRTGWYDDSPLPGQSGFQEKLSDFAGGVDQTCKYARSRNMEFWSEFTVWNGETIRYPTRTELWVMANLGLAYGVKGYDFYHFNLGVYYKSEGGDGVLDIEDRPYMTEAQCEAVFGEDVADNDFFNDDATIYYDIRCIADTLLNIVGPDFRKLKHRDGISVLHTDNLQNYFYINEIEADPYSSLSSSQIYFEVAIFEDPVDGYRHFVIVNRLCAAGDSVDYTVDLELPDGTYNIRDLYTDNVVASNLEADDYDLEDFTVRLAPGHAGLYKIEPVDLETVVTLPLDYKKATAYTNGRKIALGPRGRIHVCYTDSSTTTGVRSVWYAYTDNGTSWVKQKIADNAFCSAIAVDDAGAPYVSYLTLTDSKQVIVWSEGESRVMLGQACIPTMSIYPSEDLGIVYSSDKSGFYFMSRRFHLSSLLNYNASTVEKGYAEAINHPSCCFSDSGDAVCIARNISRPNSLAQTATFYPYTDYNAYDDQEMETIYKTYENGNHIEPNLSVQLGELWATFIDGSDIKNRITSSERTSRYQFSNEIKTILQNANATTLQMANGWPFLVFEKEVNGIPKIFFSFQRADGTWSTPDRASENGPSVYERYPHVAIDFNNGIGRIIWTQWNSDGSNTGIGFTFKDIRSDSVYVLYPNGGEVLWLGVDTLTWWWQKEVSATNQPEETTIEITYDYSPSGCDWYEIASGCYEGEYPYPDPERWFDIFLMWLTRWAFECPIWGIHGEDFVPAQVTDEARIRVTADYDGSTAADVSDANFSIIAPLKVVITEVGGGGLKTKPGGGFFSASAITNTAPAKTYERKALFNLKNPTHKTSPTDTSEAPGLLIYMPQDSTEDVVWDALSYTGLNDVILQASYNGGKSYFNEDTSTPGNPVLADSITTLDSTTLYGYFYDGIATWEVPDYPVFEGYLRMMAADTNDVTVYSDPVGPFMIPPDGGNPDMTRLDQRLIGVGTAAGKIAIAYQAKETDTSASIIRYMESDEGLGFNAPESLGTGVYPAMAEGAVVWVSE
ncbi:hypothetical protein JXM67_15275, partial [candidate division WOR-3 bacterium]|nr:hypothetical protein [candidate division WOR-3 bacterium]